MFLWYPKTKDLPIPQPKTVMVKMPFNTLFRFAEQGEPIPDLYRNRIEKAAKEIGFPLFLRTDLASGKHAWKDTCYVPQLEDLYQHIQGVVESNDCADILGLNYSGLAFRELIETDWAFKAFWGEMPVARERRYFVEGGKVLCHHPYWIEQAIAEWAEGWSKPNLQQDWRQVLSELNTETPDEVKLLSGYAEQISAVLDGYWSLDFAHGRDGTWFFIDAAVGSHSWHPEDCPVAKAKRRKR